MTSRVSSIAAAVLLVGTACSFAACGLSTYGTAEVTKDACTVDANCDDHNPCTTDACGDEGVCSHAALPDGNAPEQVAGDCAVDVCQNGTPSKVADAQDFTDDGEDCTVDACTDGAPTHDQKADGAECKSSGAKGTCTGGTCMVACGPDKKCDDGNPCTDDTCDLAMGSCVFTPLNGVPVPGVAPAAGDCRVRLCIAGTDTDVVDDTDLPKTPTDCDDEICNDGSPSNPMRPAGTTCATSGGSVCDGSGACVECNAPDDCTMLPPDDACQQRTCVAHQCGQSFTAAGTPIPAQNPGDCKKLVCDGAGATVPVADGADLPNDNNPCTSDTCSGTDPVNTPLPMGASCGPNLVCSGATAVCQGCNAPTDCQGTDTECKTRTCNAGACGWSYQPNGHAIAAQTSGDCKEQVCDGAGNVKTVAFDSDLPVDGKECTKDQCAGGVPSNPPQPIDTPCSTGYCDGVNACVQCNSAAECPGAPVCMSPTCTNHVCGSMPSSAGTVAPPQLQTSGDCKQVVCDGSGGTTQQASPGDLPNDANQCTTDACNASTPTYTPVAAGTACNQDGGQVCDGATSCVECVTDLQCTAPQTCGGGGNANVCGCTPKTCAQLGKTCGTVSDGCGGTLSCSDGVKNGSETDVDCGGNGSTCSLKCGNGKACGAADDCSSASCADGVCCNSACTGLCVACTAALKGSGSDGTCGPISAGTPSPGDCTAEASSTCGMTGTCDGAGACTLWTAGTACGTGATCMSGTQKTADACDGAGTCVAGTTTDCGDYACGATTCNQTCTLQTDCASNAYCDTNASTCQPKKASGIACVNDYECLSGQCPGTKLCQ